MIVYKIWWYLSTIFDKYNLLWKYIDRSYVFPFYITQTKLTLCLSIQATPYYIMQYTPISKKTKNYNKQNITFKFFAILSSLG